MGAENSSPAYPRKESGATWLATTMMSAPAFILQLSSFVMTSTDATSSISEGARAVPTPDELTEALRVEVYDHNGNKQALGDLIEAKRSVLIFTRHFCTEQIPPSSLPSNTQIGNGSYQPIDTYASTSSSAYPIYTDPTCRLHKILKFKSALKEAGDAEEKKDYMQNAGTTLGRVFGGIKGALGNLQHTPYIGPKALNGGEVILAADGRCEYMYRMQNTVDHTSVAELAHLIGVHPIQSNEVPSERAKDYGSKHLSLVSEDGYLDVRMKEDSVH
ncbi:hypothetical protein OPT61_g56 [Boeremia exigua]|uniref:Uncharacterized protein n=1 Tax=Boeremia exigua TaxID=749465 RepID=A0ACC2IV57_9PLEO|nr:hypothetical protein OPT61_g56 [Boeremia exigua]